MKTTFGWSHIFDHGELDLMVEYDLETESVTSATTTATGRLLGADELADLQESIELNIDLAGGWDKFKEEFQLYQG